MKSKPFAAIAETAFRDFILDADFPCLGAKAAWNSGSQTLRVFEDLGGTESTKALATALSEFHPTVEFATFIAVFERPRNISEIEFENLLWKQLRLLHERDAMRFDWDSKVAADPDDPHFSFSFGGQALYVVGMHPNSSRQARRFPWPTLIFNPHEQFERLRAEGKWGRMQETIRERDQHLQGAINPMLTDFGVQSEARQYSGRVVEETWRAPFPAAQSKCPFAH
jgi:hypothetical protein